MGAGEQEGLGRESLPVERDTPGRVKAAGRQSALHGGGGGVCGPGQGLCPEQETLSMI